MDIILSAAQGAGKTRLAWTIARHMGLVSTTAELTPFEHEYAKKGVVAAQIIESRCDFLIIDLIGETLNDAKREVEAARSRLNRNIVAVYCTQSWIFSSGPARSQGREMSQAEIAKGMQHLIDRGSIPQYVSNRVRLATPEEALPTAVIDLPTGLRFELPLLDDTAQYFYGKSFNDIGIHSRDFIVQQLVHRHTARESDDSIIATRYATGPSRVWIDEATDITPEQVEELKKRWKEYSGSIFFNWPDGITEAAVGADITSGPDSEINLVISASDISESEDDEAVTVPSRPKMREGTGRTHQILLDIARNILTNGKEHDRDAVMEAYKFYEADSLDGVAPKDYPLLHEHLIKINARVDGYATVIKMIKKGRAPEVKKLLEEFGVASWQNLSLEQATDAHHKLHTLYFNGK